MSTQTDGSFGPVMRGHASRLRQGPLDEGPASGARTTAPEGPRRGRVWRRALRWTLAIVVVVPLLLVLAGFGLLLYTSSQIERQEVAGLQPSQPMNILVTGSDSREGMTREEQRELTTGSVGGNLTDTIFVLQAGGGRTAMLAFPRDLYVTRCDGSRGRINAAVRIDGPGCLVQTITDLSGIEISHHLEVNFLGFRDIVDAVGGVEICLDEPIQDRDAGLDLPAGCQRLDGVDALGYVRVRKIDNDLERIKRQQRFVRALAQEVLSRDLLTSPRQLFDTTTAMARAVTADEDLGAVDLARVAWSMRGLAEGLDNAYTVPATPASIGGASVLQIQEVVARDLFADFADGTLLTSSTEAADRPQPSEVEVIVLNGAQVQGLASAVADELHAQGFIIADIGNAEPVDVTTIRYPTGALGAAELLEKVSGRDAELVEDPTATTISLVLGRDAVSAPA